MIRITDFFQVSLSSFPKDPSAIGVGERESLDDYLETVGGWQVFFDEISSNRTKVVMYLNLKDLIRFLSVFVRSLYPESTSLDRYGMVLRFLDQHLVASLYYRNHILKEDLDLNEVKVACETCSAYSIKSEMLSCLSLEFLLADHISTGQTRPEFLDRVKDLAYENFMLHITIIFDSIFEGNFETVFIDIPEYDHPAMKMMKDSKIPLFPSQETDLGGCVNYILENYSKEHIQDVAVRVLARRAPKQVGSVSNFEFVRSLYGERYDQIKNGDWSGFIQSELGLNYTVFFSKNANYWKFSKRVVDFILKEKPDLRLVVVPASKTV